jgi:hypothetical protein
MRAGSAVKPARFDAEIGAADGAAEQVLMLPKEFDLVWLDGHG